MSLLQMFLAGIAAFHVAAVLFGAPFVENFVNTLVWAVLMSILAILIPKLCASDCQAILRPVTQTGKEVWFILHIGLTVGGAWLGAVVLPLDWNTYWQKFPFSCCVGAVSGSLISGLMNCVRWLVLSQKKTENSHI